DNSPTLRYMKQVVSDLNIRLSAHSEAAHLLGVDLEELRYLGRMLDGSLTLRLLLETISLPPGEVQHHLATSTYLEKRDGNHGDWLARLDSLKPSKTIVSHMAKDSYAFVHPKQPRTLSVREAARI